MTLVDVLEADLDVVATLTTADHTLLAPSAPIAGLGYGVSIEHGAVPTGPLVVLEGDGGFDDDLAEAFDAAAHPRAGAGSSTGGQFVSASQGSSSSAQQGRKKPEDDAKKLSGAAAYDAANEWVYDYLDNTDDAKAGATFRARRHSANVVDIDFVVLYDDGTMSVDTARVTQTALGPIVGPVHKGHQLASKRVKAPKHLNPKTLKVREATVDVLNAINPGGTYDQPTRRAANRAAKRRRQQRRRGSSASSGFNAKHSRARAGSPTGGQFIKAGDGGPAAQGAQRRLKGKLTADSIRAYQRRHGLQEDGVIGRQTAHTLLGHKGKLKVGALTAKQSRALARQGRRSRQREASADLADRALRAAAAALEVDVTEGFLGRLKAARAEAKRGWDEGSHPRGKSKTGTNRGSFTKSQGAKGAKGIVDKAGSLGRAADKGGADPAAGHAPARELVPSKGELSAMSDDVFFSFYDELARRVQHGEHVPLSPKQINRLERENDRRLDAEDARRAATKAKRAATPAPEEPAAGPPIKSPGRSQQGNLRNFKAMSDEKLADVARALRGHKDADAWQAARAEVMRRLRERGRLPAKRQHDRAARG